MISLRRAVRSTAQEIGVGVGIQVDRVAADRCALRHRGSRRIRRRRAAGRFNEAGIDIDGAGRVNAVRRVRWQLHVAARDQGQVAVAVDDITAAAAATRILQSQSAGGGDVDIARSRSRRRYAGNRQCARIAVVDERALRVINAQGSRVGQHRIAARPDCAAIGIEADLTARDGRRRRALDERLGIHVHGSPTVSRIDRLVDRDGTVCDQGDAARTRGNARYGGQKHAAAAEAGTHRGYVTDGECVAVLKSEGAGRITGNRVDRIGGGVLLVRVIQRHVTRRRHSRQVVCRNPAHHVGRTGADEYGARLLDDIAAGGFQGDRAGRGRDAAGNIDAAAVGEQADVAARRADGRRGIRS